MGQFSENLRKTRKRLGLTQDAAGERCGLSAKYIGELERSEASPTLDAVEKIARGLSVDKLVLIGDDADRMDVAAVRAELARTVDAMDETQVRLMLRIARLAGTR